MKKIGYRLVYNRKHCLNHQGTALVQVEAYLEKRKVYFSTRVYLFPHQWDTKKQRIINHPHDESLNRMLDEFILLLEEKELEMWRKGQDISLKKLKQSIQQPTSDSFLAFAREEVQQASLKESTRSNRLSTITLLHSFRAKILFADLSFSLVSEFESFLHQAGYHINTIAKHMKHWKGLVHSAIRKGYLTAENDPFRSYKIKTKESHHVFLIPDELTRLETLTLKDQKSGLQHSLDAFLFCCYTGLRYSDFVQQREENVVSIEGKPWLCFTCVKTGAVVKLPLHLLFDGKAQALLRKYKGHWKEFFQLKSNASTNKDLVRLGKLAHIRKHFSFHAARHTNATLLIYQGVSITTVQKLLGHKHLSTTQIYSEVMETTLVRDLKKCRKTPGKSLSETAR